jgi:hypothetical protein
MNRTEHELELMRLYLEGVASLEETQELEALIVKDASLRQDFLRYTHLDSALAGVRRSQPSVVAPRRSVWFSWRPLTAAAAGIVLGIFCTSVVFAYVAPSLVKVVTLLDDSFESGPAPLVAGVPIEAGKWSGDYTEVVGEQQGVKPESGKKMLRFLRADFEGKAKPEGSYISEVHQLIDLRPYRREFADGGAVVQLSAAFNAFSFPAEEVFVCSVSLQALDAETAINGSTRIGETLLIDCLAMARNSRLKVDRDPATWQRLNAELRLPPNADFILIRIALAHTNKAQRRETFDGHYLDGVRLTLARRAPLP